MPWRQSSCCFISLEINAVKEVSRGLLECMNSPKSQQWKRKQPNTGRKWTCCVSEILFSMLLPLKHFYCQVSLVFYLFSLPILLLTLFINFPAPPLSLGFINQWFIITEIRSLFNECTHAETKTQKNPLWIFLISRLAFSGLSWFFL